MNDSQRTPDTDRPVIDMGVIDGLRELGGEDEPGLLLELIDMFLTDAPVRMHEIETSLAKGDIQTLERAAHTLKSSSANLGAKGLSAICKQIEEIARTKTLNGIAPLVRASHEAYADVEAALRAIET